MATLLPAIEPPQKVIYPPEFAGGDPNAMTCHACFGKPTALCVHCLSVICKRHTCKCSSSNTVNLVGVGSSAWDREAIRRLDAWKGST